LIVGDDRQFNKFVESYVNLLDIPMENKKEQGNLQRNKSVNSGFVIDRTKLDVRVFLIP
jgi:hypothetical protein